MAKRNLPKYLIPALGLLQVILFAAAFISIIKKPTTPKSKLLWVLISLINFIGPITYFAVGSNMLDKKAAEEWL